MKKNLLKSKKKHFLLFLALIMSAGISAQVGIGTATPNTTSILDVESTTKGFLPPRLSTIQRDAIPSPAEGLVVYNTSENCMQVYNGTTWNGLCGSSNSTKVPRVLVLTRSAPATPHTNRYSQFVYQLNSPKNYGTVGKYNKIAGIEHYSSELGRFAPIIEDAFPTGTAAQLKASWDVISIGYALNSSSYTAEQHKVLKEFVDLGGVLFMLWREGAHNIPLYESFGCTVNFVNYFTLPNPGTVASNNPIVTNGVFGNVPTDKKLTLNDEGLQQFFKAAGLPPGSEVLATEFNSPDNVAAFTMGPGNRVVAAEMGLFSSHRKVPLGIWGREIDTPTEIFIHNLWAYIFDKTL